MFLHALHQLEGHLSVEFVRPVPRIAAADRARASPPVLGCRAPSRDAHRPLGARGMEAVPPPKVSQRCSPLLSLRPRRGGHVSAKVIPRRASPTLGFGTAGIRVVKRFGFPGQALNLPRSLFQLRSGLKLSAQTASLPPPWSSTVNR